MDDNYIPAKAPLDPVQVLQARGREAAAERLRQREALRAVMSDEQVLEQFGVDLSQLDD